MKHAYPAVFTFISTLVLLIGFDSTNAVTLSVFKGSIRLSCIGALIAKRFAVIPSECTDATSVKRADTSQGNSRPSDVTNHVKHPEAQQNRNKKHGPRGRFLKEIGAKNTCDKYLTTSVYNIAILELKDDVEGPIPWLSNPNRDDEKPGIQGKTQLVGEVGNCGKYETIPLSTTIISRDECANSIEKIAQEKGYNTSSLDPNIIQDLRCKKIHVCGATKGNKTPCIGSDDEGAPLVIKDKKIKEDVFVGLATPLFECDDIGCTKNIPTVYTSIAAVKDFIDKYSNGHKWHETSYC